MHAHSEGPQGVYCTLNMQGAPAACSHTLTSHAQPLPASVQASHARLCLPSQASYSTLKQSVSAAACPASSSLHNAVAHQTGRRPYKYRPPRPSAVDAHCYASPGPRDRPDAHTAGGTQARAPPQGQPHHASGAGTARMAQQHMDHVAARPRRTAAVQAPVTGRLLRPWCGGARSRARGARLRAWRRLLARTAGGIGQVLDADACRRGAHARVIYAPSHTTIDQRPGTRQLRIADIRYPCHQEHLCVPERCTQPAAPPQKPRAPCIGPGPLV